MQFGVNHLGHFALTLRLLPLLRRQAASRVVVVSSLGHTQSKGINLDDPGNLKGKYNAQQAYFDSKLANLLFARGLQSRLDATGAADPMVVMAHPGMTKSNLSQNSLFVRSLEFMFRAMRPDQGALPQVRAAVDPAAAELDYYGPDGMGELKGYPVKVGMTDAAKDPEAVDALWSYSEDATGLTF